MADPLDGEGGRSIAFPKELDLVIEGLRRARLDWPAAHPRNAERGIGFPSRQLLKRIARELDTALFPLRLDPPELTEGNENALIAASLESTLSQLGAQIGLELAHVEKDADTAAARAAQAIGTFAAVCLACAAPSTRAWRPPTSPIPRRAAWTR